MRNTIVQIDNQNGLGVPPGRKLFRVATGEFAGRLLAVFRESVSQIQFSFADAPFNTWSAPSVIADDASTFPLDAVMAEDGTVWVVYVEQATEYLTVKKMTFESGTWAVGAKCYAYMGNSFAPSIVLDLSGTLWLSFSRLSAGFYDIQVKSSTDDGATWGAGPSDIGDTLRTALYVPFSKLLATNSRLYAVYNGTLSDLFVRWRSLTASVWGDEQLVASGSDIDEHFDAALSADGLLGIAYNSDRLYYREYDGMNWGSQIALDAARGVFPQVFFNNRFPVVVYLKAIDGDEMSLLHVHRSTGTFSSPETLEPRADTFDRVLLYDSGFGNYTDCTIAASDLTAADLFHNDSGVLLSSQKDALFLGMTRKFRSVHIHLSTPGADGTVSYSYWDGTGWKSFAPFGGNYNFDTPTRQLTLWEDLASVPADWQKNSVENQTLFWVRIEVFGNFATPPIGSSLTSRLQIESIILRR